MKTTTLGGRLASHLNKRGIVYLAAGLGAVGLVGVGAAVSSRRVVAQVQSTSPRDWASTDYRQATPDQIILGTLRLQMICGFGSTAPTSALLTLAANRPVLDPANATLIACTLGAPASATCEQLMDCLQKKGDAPPLPVCDGNTLITEQRNLQEKKSSRVGVSCTAMGQRCYQGRVGGFCGQGTCEPGSTYWCEGDSIGACQSGVKVLVPCGRGMSCGNAAGNHVIDCVGKGQTCTEGSRCEGNVLHQCMSAGFGQGNERVVDCGEFGLACKAAEGIDEAACVPAAEASDCSPHDNPSCEGDQVKLCVAGKWIVKTCAELVLPGKCQSKAAPAHVECRP